MRLLLFDIDGTLITSPGVGRRAFDRAFRDVLGWDDATTGLNFGGMTDPLIVRTVFARRGLTEAAAMEAVARLLPSYVRHLERELEAKDVTRTLPGVRPLLDALLPRHGTDAALAVLTGNVQAGAHLKLRANGLHGYFAFGAYGDDGHRRSDLLPVALERARAAVGRDFPMHHVVVVGDTPADIEVARTHGACVVAVATGASPREELEAHRPDALLDDLSRVDAVTSLLLS